MDGRAVSLLAPSSSGDALTAREMEVASLLADGLRHKHIANRLRISEKTVAAHIASAARKIPGRGLPSRKLAIYGVLLRLSPDSASAA